MDKNGLAPTRVMNKNGVMTTVYKRGDGASGSSVTFIPKPSVQPAPADDSVDLDLHNAMRQVGMDPKVRSKIYATLHPDTMKRLSNFPVNTRNTLLSPYKRVMQNSVMHRNFASLNNFALIAEEEGYPGSSRENTILYALAGMNYYTSRGEPLVDFCMDPDSEHVKQSKAVFTVLLNTDSELLNVGVSKTGSEMNLIFKDKALAQFIKDNHDKADAIVSLLNSRRKFDLELFTEAIEDGRSTALVEGTL